MPASHSMPHSPSRSPSLSAAQAFHASALTPLALALCLVVGFGLLVDAARGQAIDVNARYAEGVAALRAGDLATAETALRDVVAERPEWSGGHLVLGQVVSRRGDLADALTHYERAHELEPSSASALALAHTAFAVGRTERAGAVLDGLGDPAKLAAPERVTYHRLRATRALQEGRLDASVASWRSAIAASPRDAELHRMLGITFGKARRWSDAAEMFERALELAPRDTVATYELVRARGELLGEVEADERTQACARAWSAGRRLLELSRRDVKPDTIAAVARFAACAGEPDTAATLLADFGVAGDLDAAFDVALAYAQERRWTDVLGAAAPALEAPTDAESANAPPSVKQRGLVRLTGLAHEARENWDDAIAAYRLAGDRAGIERVDTNRRLEEREREEAELFDMLEQLQEQAAEI